MQNYEPLAVTTAVAPDEELTPGELKALVARIRQGFGRPLPEE